MADFWPRVDRTESCWVWQGTRFQSGYGAFQLDGRLQRAHRLAYETLVGRIPDGLQLDHLCRNRPCVNPGHLEPVTPRTNVRRSEGPPAMNARKVACSRGHAFTPENTYFGRDGRHCRPCARMTETARRAKRRESSSQDPDKYQVRYGDQEERHRAYCRSYYATHRSEILAQKAAKRARQAA